MTLRFLENFESLVLFLLEYLWLCKSGFVDGTPVLHTCACRAGPAWREELPALPRECAPSQTVCPSWAIALNCCTSWMISYFKFRSQWQPIKITAFRSVTLYKFMHVYQYFDLRGRRVKIYSFYSFMQRCMGRDSSDSIATPYGLDGPGIESRWERDFPHPSRPALGPTLPAVQWLHGLSRG